jgi:hypothetical protein
VLREVLWSVRPSSPVLGFAELDRQQRALAVHQARVLSPAGGAASLSHVAVPATIATIGFSRCWMLLITSGTLVRLPRGIQASGSRLRGGGWSQAWLGGRQGTRDATRSVNVLRRSAALSASWEAFRETSRVTPLQTPVGLDDLVLVRLAAQDQALALRGAQRESVATGESFLNVGRRLGGGYFVLELDGRR